MIGDEQRRAALAHFPPATPLLILAPPGAGYAALLAERNDPAIELGALAAASSSEGVLHPTIPHVLLEGIDELARPILFLAGLRARAPQARLFALVSNAAHAASLGTFYAGGSLGAGHPFVREELPSLFAAAGWQPLAITALPDPAIAPLATVPAEIVVAGLGVRVRDAPMRERTGTAAFLVVADPA